MPMIRARTMIDHTTELEYAGFWLRVLASLIDSILLTLLMVPILIVVAGEEEFIAGYAAGGTAEFIVSWILPAVAVIAFWLARGATPGKMAISAIIIDEKTAGPPSLSQHIGRYLAYFLAIIPLGLGLIWVGFDQRKQGWHDKLAGTLVVRVRK